MDMYHETVRLWITEMKEEGKIEGLDKEEGLEQLVREYARKLEAYYEEAVKRQLEPLGKVAEFERMMLFDGQYMNKYLNQTIPGYPAFKMDVFNQAKKMITGK